MHDVFVYGTLMTTGKNHHIMDGAVFTGKAETFDSAYMKIDVGEFDIPGLIPGNEVVFGELYEVSDEHLELLDYFEHNGHWYQREKISVICNGTVVDAWVYMFCHDSFL